MHLSDVEGIIINGKYKEVAEIVNTLVNDKNTESCNLLIKCLLATNKHEIRNLLALALSDLGCSKSVKDIIGLFKNPKTLNNRGTLLYALEQLDYSCYIEDIVELLDQENFEVRVQSFILLQKAEDKLSKEIREKCLEKLINKAECAREKLQLLEDAIELMQN